MERKLKTQAFFVIIAVLLFNTVASALGRNAQNDPVTRQLAPFTSVRFDGGYDVELVASDKESIAIKAEGDKIDRIKTIVANGRLQVYTEEPVQYYKVKLIVYYKKITEIKINGGVNFRNSEIIKADSLYIKVAGGGDIRFQTDCKYLNLDFSGGANADISGNTESLIISMNGAARVETEKLTAQNAKVELAGAGYASVCAKLNLDAIITGVGAIYYTGSPQKVKSQIIGIGTIKEKL